MTIFNGKIHYKWPFSIAFCMFTRGYSCSSRWKNGCLQQSWPPQKTSLRLRLLKGWNTGFAASLLMPRPEKLESQGWDLVSLDSSEAGIYIITYIHNYLFIYIYVYTCIYIYIHTCIYIYTHTWSKIHASSVQKQTSVIRDFFCFTKSTKFSDFQHPMPWASTGVHWVPLGSWPTIPSCAMARKGTSLMLVTCSGTLSILPHGTLGERSISMAYGYVWKWGTPPMIASHFS